MMWHAALWLDSMVRSVNKKLCDMKMKLYRKQVKKYWLGSKREDSLINQGSIQTRTPSTYMWNQNINHKSNYIFYLSYRINFAQQTPYPIHFECFLSSSKLFLVLFLGDWSRENYCFWLWEKKYDQLDFNTVTLIIYHMFSSF